MPNSSSEIRKGRGFVIGENVGHPCCFACHDGLVEFAPWRHFPFTFHALPCDVGAQSSYPEAGEAVREVCTVSLCPSTILSFGVGAKPCGIL